MAAYSLKGGGFLAIISILQFKPIIFIEVVYQEAKPL